MDWKTSPTTHPRRNLCRAKAQKFIAHHFAPLGSAQLGLDHQVYPPGCGYFSWGTWMIQPLNSWGWYVFRHFDFDLSILNGILGIAHYLHLLTSTKTIQRSRVCWVETQHLFFSHPKTAAPFWWFWGTLGGLKIIPQPIDWFRRLTGRAPYRNWCVNIRLSTVLVGGWALPLWKMMEFVSWDDDIPNWMKVIKFMFQTTNQCTFSQQNQSIHPIL